MGTLTNRSNPVYQLRYALRNPKKVPPYMRRMARDLWLRATTKGHVGYYRAVMKSDVARDPEGAVGSHTHKRWLELGKLQFDYLLRHGLKPDHRVLEIGCGNLRAGWRFIDYLDAGNYYGLDISPDILLSANKTVVRHGLQGKEPTLRLVDNLTFDFLPDQRFDVVHAHSVFSHTPITVIDECLAHVGRIMRPDGHFDFTFDRTVGTEHHVLREDFYYRTETLVELAARRGFTATFMKDWEKGPHKQSKLRLTARLP